MTTTVMTRAVARMLLAPALMVALAILVKGYATTGDGFAAGALVALAVLLQYVALGQEEVERRLPVRRAGALAVAGLLLALAVALVPVALGKPILTHFPPPDASVVKVGSLELITAVVFDVGVFLLVLGATLTIVRTIAAARETSLRAEAARERDGAVEGEPPPSPPGAETAQQPEGGAP